MRARMILRDFEYGIVPGVSVDVRDLILQFRDGEPTARQAAFDTLVYQGRMPVVERLISLQADPTMRSIWLSSLLKDATFLADFESPQALRDLVRRVGLDLDSQWQTQTTAMLLFSPAMITSMIRNDSLDAMLRFQTELSDEERMSYALTLFSNNPSIRILVANGRHGLLPDILGEFADSAVRSRLADLLFADPAVVQMLAQREMLASFLNAIGEQVDASSRQTMMTRALRLVVGGGLSNSGLHIDTLLPLIDQVDDAAQQGQLLGQALANPTVVAQLDAANRLSMLIEASRRLDAPEFQRAYLSSLIKSNVFATLDVKGAAETILKLWDCVQEIEDSTLHRDAIVRLLRVSAFLTSIREASRTQALLKRFENMDVDLLKSTVPMLVNSEDAMEVFQASGVLDEIVVVLCRLPRMDRLKSLALMSARLSAMQVDPKRREIVLLELADAVDERYRCDFLTALAVQKQSDELSRQIVQRLLEQSQAEHADNALWAVSRLGSAFEELHNPDAVRWINEGLQHASLKTIADFVVAIQRDEKLRTLLLEAGSYDTIIRQAKQARDDVAEKSARDLLLLDPAVSKALSDGKQARQSLSR
ncbi:MAG: hypothetical protein R3C05_13560 [Pirellulaceae bacterium]